MKKKVLLFLIAISLVLSVFAFSISANTFPKKGDTLPMISLPIPKSPEAKEYLGISGEGTFKIPQIKARVLFIEIFSMYCPYCQKDAPGINELYQLIDKSEGLRDKIKMIGIGAGNTPFEVEVYKKTYNVSFPLFPDKDFTIHKMLGEVRTPFFIIVRINKDKTHEVVHSQLGGFQGADSFFKLILETSGLIEEGKK